MSASSASTTTWSALLFTFIPTANRIVTPPAARYRQPTAVFLNPHSVADPVPPRRPVKGAHTRWRSRTRSAAAKPQTLDRAPRAAAILRLPNERELVHLLRHAIEAGWPRRNAARCGARERGSRRRGAPNDRQFRGLPAALYNDRHPKIRAPQRIQSACGVPSKFVSCERHDMVRVPRLCRRCLARRERRTHRKFQMHVRTAAAMC